MRFLLFLITLVFCVNNSNSQSLVNITNNGSSGFSYTSTYLVVNNNYNGTGEGMGWSANLYLPSEMGGSNQLKSMRFLIDKATTTAGLSHTFTNVKIYLFHYGLNTQFTSLNKPNMSVLSGVKVYDGDITFNSPTNEDYCESEIIFSTNFDYIAGNSLGVYIERTVPFTGSQATSPYWGFLEDPNQNMVRHISNWDGTNANPLPPVSKPYTDKYKYPQIKFNETDNTHLCAVYCSVASPNGTSSQSFCASSSPKISDLIAAPPSGTTLKWYNAASNGTAYLSTDVLENGKTYYGVGVTSSSPSCESSTRLAVLVNIKSTTQPTATNTTQSFCSSSSPKISDLVANTTVGNSLKWYDAATNGNAFVSTDLLETGKTYYAAEITGGTPNCESATRLAISVIINNPSVPTTSNSSQIFCASATPKVSDLVATTTPGSSIKWYNAATNGTAYASTAALETGKTYYAVETTGGTLNCESVSRLAVTVSLLNPAVPTTTNSTQTFCASASPKVSNLVANTTSGTILKWYDAATNGTAYTSTAALETGKTYYAVESLTGTPGCESASRLAVNVSLIDPSAPVITNTTQSFCSSISPKISDLVATISVGSTLKWYNASTNGTAYNSNDVLENGKTYYGVEITSGALSCESTTRSAVAVVVVNPPVPTTSNSNQIFCISDNPKISNLIATVSTGSSINWYGSASSNVILPSTDALIDGATYFASEATTGSLTCESTSRLAVTVKINTVPDAPTGSNNQFFCATDNPLVSDIVAKGISLKWYESKVGGNAYDSNTPLVDGSHYYATQTINQGCEGILRLEVVVYISNPTVQLESKKEPFCNINDGGIKVKVIGGIGNNSYTWENGTASSTIDNIGAGIYTVNVIDSVGCSTKGVFDIECIKSPIPQVITPGDNGKNETWILKLSPKAEVKIFNRWGSLIYAASPYLDDWKGQTNHGVALGNGFLPSGTYFYTIDSKDGGKILTGYIELIR